jgi:hypothetical protein
MQHLALCCIQTSPASTPGCKANSVDHLMLYINFWACGDIRGSYINIGRDGTVPRGFPTVTLRYPYICRDGSMQMRKGPSANHCRVSVQLEWYCFGTCAVKADASPTRRGTVRIRFVSCYSRWGENSGEREYSLTGRAHYKDCPLVLWTAANPRSMADESLRRFNRY